MTDVNIYDIEAKLLNDVADQNDTTVAEVVEVLCSFIEEAKEDQGWR